MPRIPRPANDNRPPLAWLLRTGLHLALVAAVVAGMIAYIIS